MYIFVLSLITVFSFLLPFLPFTLSLFFLLYNLSSFYLVLSFLSFLLLFSHFLFYTTLFLFHFPLVLLDPFSDSFRSFLRFFSLSLSALLRSLDINTPACCSENRSLFALTRTSFAASSSFSFTSTGLILYSSLFFPA